jgi:hypothetical protein
LATFSLLAGGLIGFFNLGATLMLASQLAGSALVSRLLATSWLHASLEFLFVLICVAEPLRLAWQRIEGTAISRFLWADINMLFISLIGLLASAAIEVFAGL